jgi:hypothetical protein
MWLISGAVLLKGFSIDSGADFQSAVQQYCPQLCDEYRGTSPRNLVPGTEVKLDLCPPPLPPLFMGVGKG